MHEGVFCLADVTVFVSFSSCIIVTLPPACDFAMQGGYTACKRHGPLRLWGTVAAMKGWS